VFDDRTVLVLGAGASRPYGFPTSSELRKLILGGGGAIKTIEARGFADPIREAKEHEAEMVQCAMQRPQLMEQFRTVFRGSQRISIDSLIAGGAGGDLAGSFEAVACNVVTSIIMRCESRAKLDGDWYQWLLEFLIAE